MNHAHLHVPEVGAHVVGVVPELDGDDGAVAHDEGLAIVPIRIETQEIINLLVIFHKFQFP